MAGSVFIVSPADVGCLDRLDPRRGGRAEAQACGVRLHLASLAGAHELAQHDQRIRRGPGQHHTVRRAHASRLSCAGFARLEILGHTFPSRSSKPLTEVESTLQTYFTAPSAERRAGVVSWACDDVFSTELPADPTVNKTDHVTPKRAGERLTSGVPADLKVGSREVETSRRAAYQLASLGANGSLHTTREETPGLEDGKGEVVESRAAMFHRRRPGMQRSGSRRAESQTAGFCEATRGKSSAVPRSEPIAGVGGFGAAPTRCDLNRGYTRWYHDAKEPEHGGRPDAGQMPADAAAPIQVGAPGKRTTGWAQKRGTGSKLIRPGEKPGGLESHGAVPGAPA
ncbi:hypothetical protein JHW43_007282 [Diplocarpon mali]|nr:hypothetical protein JHW43_007282 [Diplocarpon mali]